MSAVESFWRDFADASRVDAGYSAWAFGSDDDPGLQAKLGFLVRDGPKRATTGLLSDYEQEGEALPEAGDYSVILDGRGGPLCIIRTTHVELRPFGEVDAEFARVEGEGDRSLDYWRRAHLRFFDRLGIEIDDGTMMVLERFDLVWPRQGTGSN
jgi:uncharacterized protein YhfF